jgi:hypothetical protein
MRNDFDHLEEELIEYFIHGFMAHRDRTPQELANISEEPWCAESHDMWLMARTIDPFVRDETIAECIQEGYNKRAIQGTDIHTLRSALWLARQAMDNYDVPDAGARSAVDAALLATGGLEVDDTPAALAANYQEAS